MDDGIKGFGTIMENIQFNNIYKHLFGTLSISFPFADLYIKYKWITCIEYLKQTI